MLPHIGCFCEVDRPPGEALRRPAEHHHQGQPAQQGKRVAQLGFHVHCSMKTHIGLYVLLSLNHQQVLGIVAGVLLIDHDVRGTEFQQVFWLGYMQRQMLAEIIKISGALPSDLHHALLGAERT